MCCKKWSLLEWMQLLKQRNNEVLVCLWTELNKWASQYCQRRSIDKSIGERAAEIAFFKLLKIADNEPTKITSNFCGYARMMLIREILNQLPPGFIDDLDTEDLEKLPSDQLDSTLSLNPKARQALLHCLDRRTDLHRTALLLRYILNLSSRCVASILEKTTGAIDGATFSARASMAKCLSAKKIESIDDALSEHESSHSDPWWQLANELMPNNRFSPKEAKSIIQQCICDKRYLTSTECVVITLVDFIHASTEETATVLNLEESDVAQSKKSAREKLRKCLQSMP